LLPEKLGVVMVMVSDMERSVAFYRDTLGLPLRFQSPEWTEFATEGVTLALHGGAPARAAGSADQRPEAGRVEMGWTVGDLDAVWSGMKARGVQFALEPTERPGEGIRLAVFLAPDGCRLSLAQIL
jgi:catechol 2,3-dioxygenase-like lactoylglutathione lyase family enzyme